MDELVAFLMKHLVIDIDGHLTLDAVNEMLARDEAPVSQDLRARLIAENGLDDFLLVLADCLRDSLRDGIKEDTVRRQVLSYLEA